jgi:hypothetical protein
MTLKGIIISFTLLFLLTACCTSYEPLPSDAFDFKGNWTGTIQDSVGGQGTLIVSILFQSSGQYREVSLGGRWEADFGEKGKSAGLFNGTTFDYETIDGVLNPNTAIDCNLFPTLVRNGNSVSATYSAVSDLACQQAGFGQGSLTLTRQ